MVLQNDIDISMPTKTYRVRKRPPSKPVRKSERLQQAKEKGLIAAVNPLPSPQSDKRTQDSKRKRVRENDSLSDEEPLPKKAFIYRTTPPSNNHKTSSVSRDYGAPVYWKDYFNNWPPTFSEQATRMRESRPTKRAYPPSRSNSYSQSVRDGSSPAAWTRQHEERMQEAGLIMTEYQDLAKITTDCQWLCERLLKAEFPLPKGPSFQSERLRTLFQRTQFRNEARIVRDVTPIVVPSAELLHIDGQSTLVDICEAMNAEWTQCDTMCGPRPKPDYVAGISASALTNEEKGKLRLHHTSTCPNLFPENMYFPFVICEVKGSDRPVREAERQAMHSASIAIRAVIQLYQKVSATTEVDRKILAFSVAHDNSTVKIFGHFAKIEDEKITFFRHRLYATDFAAGLASHELGRAYKITRAIYEEFFPQHLARIRNAISQLRSPSLASFTDQLGFEEDSRESTPAQSSSQEDGKFKKPSLPSGTKLQQENDRLREQLVELVREHQAASHRQQENLDMQKTMMERQLAEQKVMMEKQLVRQNEESREQKIVLERQLSQQKEQMERQLAQQKEESQDQKTMMEQQLAQQQEIIKLLKESRSR